MSQTPLATVIVLNFNGETIIRRCLECLIAQTYSPLEILVVDNGSTDGSRAILEAYERANRLTLIRAPGNLGVPAGRNLGLRHAKGEVIAFIDNDGYAHPTWLAAAVRTLRSRAELGAVASVVFFDAHKIILNGAGGTVDRRGQGVDFCFNEPYELARFPDLVLYPMGCGMVIWRHVMDQIGELDPLLFNYYDDTELGIRIWKRGLAVAVAPDAWIDHGYGYSDTINRNKWQLGERNRIRTVLKYFPAWWIPVWLLREAYLPEYLGMRGLAGVRASAWLWNLRHLRSALAIRRQFASGATFWPLVRTLPKHPNNVAFRPDPRRCSAAIGLDGRDDRGRLSFGWYGVEHDDHLAYRWTARRAGGVVRLTAPVHSGSLELRTLEAPQRARLALRPLGELDPVLEVPIELHGTTWQRPHFACDLPSGDYEVLLECERGYADRRGRTIGVAVSSIVFH